MLYRISLFSLLCLTLAICACEQEKNYTFNKDVAPIIHKNCSPCHRLNAAGPFSLISYKDLRRKITLVEELVKDGTMPPWPADTAYSSFLNQLALNKKDKTILLDWIEQGFPEGLDEDKTAEPKFTEGSYLGKPDMVLDMMDSVEIPGNNTDLFVAIKIPFEIGQDTFIKAIEFVPDNKQLVHHMNGHMVLFEEEKKQDVYEGIGHVFPDFIDLDGKEAADSVNQALGLLHDDGSYPKLVPSVSNYLPGVLPQAYPDGIGGYEVGSKGAIYIRNMHYGPSPIKAYDKSKINLFFSPNPPKRPIQETQLGTLGVSPIEPPFILQPEEVKTFTSKLYCSIDISLLTVNPHMHLLGTEFWAYAVDPNGDTIPLIKINDWDFRWQFFYTYPKMLKIPKGSTIYAHGTFDNRSSNPNNPFDPPRVVRPPTSTNMKTTDEMFQFIFNYLPYQAGDENISLDISQ